MLEPPTAVAKDPSLKRYFKYMLTNRKMSVQFTSRKIRDIIETDLCIKLEPPQSLYARVCIEAFPYYMQSWPEWNLAIKSQYSGALYDCLVTYLRHKLLYLKPRENAYKQISIEKNTILLKRPTNMQITLKKGLKKVRSPYSIKVHIPQHSWNNTLVTLKNYGTNNIYLELDNPSPSDHDFGAKELLNHPHVFAELDIPGIIHFTRSTPFKIESFLQTASDDVIENDTTNIVSIEESDKISPHKVYTYELMTSFFQALNAAVAKYKAEPNDSWRVQISLLCEAFLLDIFESNVKSTTVCEGSTVNYNIGKSTYCLNNNLNSTNALNEPIVFRKSVTPIVSYNLISCDVTQESLTENGFDNFAFIENAETGIDKNFLTLLKKGLKYKCLVCNVYFSLHDLKKHLIDTHPQEKKYKCVRCSQITTISKLLLKRWKHDCRDPSLIDILTS